MQSAGELLVRSPKLTVAFSQSSYIVMTYRVVGTRTEFLHSCEGLGDGDCRCQGEGNGYPEGFCWFENKKLRVERSAGSASAGGATGQRQLCVPMAG